MDSLNDIEALFKKYGLPVPEKFEQSCSDVEASVALVATDIMAETVKIIIDFARANVPNTDLIESINVGSGITAIARKIVQFEGSCNIATSAGKVNIKYVALGGTVGYACIKLDNNTILSVRTTDGLAPYGSHVARTDLSTTIFKELYALRDICLSHSTTVV